MKRSLLVAAALVALGLAAALGGMAGGLGMALGLAAGGLGIWSLWAMTGLLANAAQAGASPKSGLTTGLLILLAKLPLFLLIFLFARRLGDAAGSCFIAGVVVVYFTTVGLSVYSAK